MLRGVDLTLEPGETVALVGPSGGGKSTLLSLLLRLAEPGRRRGSPAAASTCATSTRPPGAGRLAWVPQRPTIFAGTVADNVALARPDASDWSVLGRGPARPACSTSSSTCRRGWRRGSARAGGGSPPARRSGSASPAPSCCDAPLLLLDEPTAHLDEDTELGVVAAIERLAAGRTALIVAHRPELARHADRVVELRDGVVRDRSPALAEAVAA